MNNNVLEFIVRMKDLMGGQLAKLAQTGKNTFAKIDSNVKQTMNNIKFMGNSVNELRNRLLAVNEVRFGTVMKSEFKAATAEAKRLEMQIAKLEGRRGGASGRGIMGGLGAYLGPLVIAGALMSFGKSSIKSAMDFDAQRTSFSVLTGSKSKGNDLAANLRELKQDTIMGPTVYKNAQTMLGFGVSLDKVVPTMRRLGDISMGDADKLKRLTLAFSEVSAAGVLNGRRMLQFVNAGFNPLLAMTKTTGKSVGELTEMLHKGKISIGMLEDSIKSATSAGGRFNNMLNVMAETPLGKMKRLQGQWAAFKIDAGEAMLPMVESAMEFGSKIVKLMNIHKSIPETLQIERATISGVVAQITSLNQHNTYRAQLMQKLKDDYPEYFSKLDTEKSSNAELLKILNDVNAAYDKRIQLASSDLIINTANKDLFDAQKDVIKYTTLMDLHNRGDIGAEHQMRSWADAFNANKPGNTAMGYYQQQLEASQKLFDEKQGIIKNEGQLKASKENYYLLQQSLDLVKNNDLEKLFKTKDGKDLFLAEIPKIAALKSIIEDGDFLNFKKVAGYDFERLRKMIPTSVNAAGITPGKATDETTKAAGMDVASSMTSGGPRIININGVKFTDKIEIHAGTMDGGLEQLEKKLEDYFLRILNSGASVQ